MLMCEYQVHACSCRCCLSAVRHLPGVVSRLSLRCLSVCRGQGADVSGGRLSFTAHSTVGLLVYFAARRVTMQLNASVCVFTKATAPVV